MLKTLPSSLSDWQLPQEDAPWITRFGQMMKKNLLMIVDAFIVLLNEYAYTDIMRRSGRFSRIFYGFYSVFISSLFPSHHTLPHPHPPSYLSLPLLPPRSLVDKVSLRWSHLLVYLVMLLNALIYANALALVYPISLLAYALLVRLFPLTSSSVLLSFLLPRNPLAPLSTIGVSSMPGRCSSSQSSSPSSSPSSANATTAPASTLSPHAERSSITSPTTRPSVRLPPS